MQEKSVERRRRAAWDNCCLLIHPPTYLAKRSLSLEPPVSSSHLRKHKTTHGSLSQQKWQFKHLIMQLILLYERAAANVPEQLASFIIIKVWAAIWRRHTDEYLHTIILEAAVKTKVHQSANAQTDISAQNSPPTHTHLRSSSFVGAFWYNRPATGLGPTYPHT